jgi:hypothetical protein
MKIIVSLHFTAIPHRLMVMMTLRTMRPGCALPLLLGHFVRGAERQFGCASILRSIEAIHAKATLGAGAGNGFGKCNFQSIGKAQLRST